MTILAGAGLTEAAESFYAHAMAFLKDARESINAQELNSSKASQAKEIKISLQNVARAHIQLKEVMDLQGRQIFDLEPIIDSETQALLAAAAQEPQRSWRVKEKRTNVELQLNDSYSGVQQRMSDAREQKPSGSATTNAVSAKDVAALIESKEAFPPLAAQVQKPTQKKQRKNVKQRSRSNTQDGDKPTLVSSDHGSQGSEAQFSTKEKKSKRKFFPHRQRGGKSNESVEKATNNSSQEVIGADSPPTIVDGAHVLANGDTDAPLATARAAGSSGTVTLELSSGYLHRVKIWLTINACYGRIREIRADHKARSISVVYCKYEEAVLWYHHLQQIRKDQLPEVEIIRLDETPTSPHTGSAVTRLILLNLTGHIYLNFLMYELESSSLLNRREVYRGIWDRRNRAFILFNSLESAGDFVDAYKEKAADFAKSIVSIEFGEEPSVLTPAQVSSLRVLDTRGLLKQKISFLLEPRNACVSAPQLDPSCEEFIPGTARDDTPTEDVVRHGGKWLSPTEIDQQAVSQTVILQENSKACEDNIVVGSLDHGTEDAPEVVGSCDGEQLPDEACQLLEHDGEIAASQASEAMDIVTPAVEDIDSNDSSEHNEVLSTTKFAPVLPPVLEHVATEDVLIDDVQAATSDSLELSDSVASTSDLPVEPTQGTTLCKLH